MTDIQTITTRDMLRNYKGVMAKVHQTGQPLLIMNKREVQVALISVADLQQLHLAKQRSASKTLLKLIGLIPKGSGLPTDLATNHSDYAWN